MLAVHGDAAVESPRRSGWAAMPVSGRPPLWRRAGAPKVIVNSATSRRVQISDRKREHGVGSWVLMVAVLALWLAVFIAFAVFDGHVFLH
jgi:hypothetical protein